MFGPGFIMETPFYFLLQPFFPKCLLFSNFQFSKTSQYLTLSEKCVLLSCYIGFYSWIIFLFFIPFSPFLPIFSPFSQSYGEGEDNDSFVGLKHKSVAFKTCSCIRQHSILNGEWWSTNQELERNFFGLLSCVTVYFTQLTVNYATYLRGIWFDLCV